MTPPAQARPAAVRWLAAGLALGGMLWLFVQTSDAASEHQPVKKVHVPAPPPPITSTDTLAAGETLAELLSENGLDGPSVHDLTMVLREVKSPRTLRTGVVARLAGLPGEAPHALALQVNADSVVEMRRSGDEWSAVVHEVPTTLDTIVIAGHIDSSLWFATLSGETDRMRDGEFKEYVYHLADVFMWKIDFTRDIRPGDAFRLAVERELRPDGSVRAPRFLAIEFANRGRVIQAIPFARPDGHREFFDSDGGALRGSFLRYPVNFRVTSSFNRRRYHPVLKRRRAHLGTDYGAPHGTPVKVTAAGTVTRAGTWGGYGRMVEVRHAKGISTRYAHLSRVGVRVGQPVAQGDIIGRVGSTGLSTAAHLHYEFLQHGKQRNPSTVDLPSAPALEADYLPAFESRRDQSLALLDGVALPVFPDAAPVRTAAAD